MKIAVTGANGHVGINLCQQLQKGGETVRALIHENDFALKHIETETVKGDLLDIDSIRPFVEGVEVVFHLAAKISISGDLSGTVRRMNVEGTRNIIKAAKDAGVKRFIHFSSIHAINQEPLDQTLDETRELVNHQAFSYDQSKAEGERMVMEAAKNGLDAFVLSPTAIIGPMDYEPSLMGKAFLQLYHRQIPSLVPGGYNWVDVRDIVETAIFSIQKGKRGEKYLLSGKWHSLKDIAFMIGKVAGKKTVQTELPFWVAKAGLPFTTLYSQVMHSTPLYTSESLEIIRRANKFISNAKACAELGFNPRPVEETIRDTFEWFRDKNFLTHKVH
jgi:dihydroflavonol-4-reductase